MSSTIVYDIGLTNSYTKTIINGKGSITVQRHDTRMKDGQQPSIRAELIQRTKFNT